MDIRPYFIINGKSSKSIQGLIVSELAPITKAQVRTLIETVDGRDGDIVTPLGYAAYDKPVKIGLAGNYDIDEIIEYLNSEGIIVFSNEPDKYYRFAVYNEIDFERLIRFKSATVVFHVQPYKFSTTEEEKTFNIGDGSSVTIKNSGNTDARPDLILTGSGDINVDLNGNQILALQLGDNTRTIEISAEDMNAYGTENAIKNVKAEIIPYQDLNGYTEPWPAGAGKNLVYKIIQNANINSSGVIQTESSFSLAVARVKANQTYTATTDEAQFVGAYFTDDPDISSTSYDGSRVVLNTKTITAAIDGYVVFRMSPSYATPQLETGSSATSYAPISNICNITGYTEVNETRAGKNLFIQDNPYISAGSGVTFEINSDKSITLSGTATSNAFLILFTNKILEAGTYTMKKTGNDNIKAQIRAGNISGVNVFDAGSNDQTGTITTGIYAGLIRIASGTNCNGITIYPQLERGSQASDYAEYLGDNYNIDFGVNQWDEEWENGGINTDTGVPEPDATKIRSKNFTPVLPNTDYYIVYKSGNCVILFYDANYNYISFTGRGLKRTPDNCYYAKLRLGASSEPVTEYENNAGINYPATITSYRQYIGAGIVYAGELDITLGKLTIKSATINPYNFTNVRSGTSAGGLHWCDCPLNNIDINGATFSNMLKQDNAAGWGSQTPCYAVYYESSLGSNNIRVYCYESDTAEFKTNYAGLMIVYTLAEPIEISLTPQEIGALVGVNSLFSDVIGGDTSVEYKTDGETHTETDQIVSFSVSVSDIDINKMTLLNRLVTGDYDKIRLKKGNNILTFTGDVKQVSIDKYSRWI